MADSNPSVGPGGAQEFRDNGGSLFLQGGKRYGGLYLTDSANNPVGLGGPTTRERRALLGVQASAFVGDKFTDYYADGLSASEGWSSAGFIGTTVTPIVAGRCGGGKILFSMTGAGGVMTIRQSIPFSPGLAAQTVFLADATNDPFYTSTGAAVTTVSAAGEIVLCGFFNLGVFGATDAATNPGFYLGLVGTTSTTHLVIKSWDTFNPKVTDTGVTIEIGAAAFHDYAMAHRLGTLYVLLDGVVVFTIPFCNIFNQWLSVLAVQPMFCMRTTTAAVNAFGFDYTYAAGPQL